MGRYGHLPLGVVVADGRHALLDGVLVRAGEGRVDEVAGVGVAGVDGQAGGVLGHPAHLLDVAEVEGRVDALGEEVHGQRHDVDVAGPLAVAEQGALDPVGPGQHGQLGRRHRGAAVVVRVQAQHDRVTVLDGAPEPLDDVGVDVGAVHLDRGRQVQDDRPLGRRLDHVHDRLADLHGELGLGAGEALRRVLVADFGAGNRLLELLAQARPRSTAMSMMPALSSPNTTRRWSSETEL